MTSYHLPRLMERAQAYVVTIVCALALSVTPNVLATHFPVLDRVVASGSMFVAYRVAAPAGAEVYLTIDAKTVLSEEMWAALRFYDADLNPEAETFVGLHGPVHVIHVEGPDSVGVVHHEDSGVSGGGGRFLWDVGTPDPTSEAGEWVLAGWLGTDGEVAAEFRLEATQGVVMLGRTVTSADFLRDSEGAFGGPSVMVHRPLAVNSPKDWAGATVQLGAERTDGFEQRTWAFFLSLGLSPTRQITYEGPGGKASTPPVCVLCPSWLWADGLAPGDYTFRIDLNADANHFAGPGSMPEVRLFTADAPIP